MKVMESLAVGDAVSIQGVLQIETRQGKLAGLFVVAGQVMPLRKRSISRGAESGAGVGSPMGSRVLGFNLALLERFPRLVNLLVNAMIQIPNRRGR